MTQVIFVTQFDTERGQPTLPDAEIDGYDVHADGSDGYGWVTLSNTPTDNTCVVLINSTQTVIDAMTADERWLFVETIE